MANVINVETGISRRCFSSDFSVNNSSEISVGRKVKINTTIIVSLMYIYVLVVLSREIDEFRNNCRTVYKKFRIGLLGHLEDNKSHGFKLGCSCPAQEVYGNRTMTFVNKARSNLSLDTLRTMTEYHEMTSFLCCRSDHRQI